MGTGVCFCAKADIPLTAQALAGVQDTDELAA